MLAVNSRLCGCHSRHAPELVPATCPARPLHMTARLCFSPPPPHRQLTKVHVFDGLKNLFSSNKSGQAKQQPEDLGEQEEENDGEEKGSTMMRIDSESGGLGAESEAFGPLAVLLVGFLQEEVDHFRRFMIDMDADMVKIVPATQMLLEGTLQAAVESEYPQYEQPRLGTRRAVFLSGMYGSEVVEVVSAYRDSGLPPTVFAAAVPNNYGRIVEELVSEVHADNAAMTKRVQEARARQALEQDSS